MPEIGKVIQKHRIQRELTAKQLAQMAQVSPGYMNKIEEGIHYPSLRTLSRIANALGLPLWVIIKEAEE